METIGLNITSNETDAVNGARQVEIAVDRIGNASKRTAASSGLIAEQIRRVRSEVASLALAFAGIQGIRSLANQADLYANLSAKIKLTTGSAQEFASSQARVFAIAQRTSTSLEATTTLYTRLSASLKQYGGSASEVAGITETVNKALAVSGATAQESASAILQLSQAMGAGRLGGEEFNAVNEAGGRIMEAIANSLGVQRGELKKLAEQGKLTTAVLRQALSGDEAAKIAAQYSQLPLTIGRAFTQLSNSFTRFIGEADQASGVSRALAQAIQFASENIDVLVGVIGGAALLFAIAVFGKLVLAAQAAVVQFVAIRVAAIGFTASIGPALLTFIGGPLGLAIITVGALTAAWVLLKSEATKQSEAATKGIQAEIDKNKELTDAIYERLKASGVQTAGPGTDVEQKRAEIIRLDAAVTALQIRLQSVSREGQELAIISQIELLRGRADEARQKLNELEQSASELAIAQQIASIAATKYGTELINSVTEIAKGSYTAASAIRDIKLAMDALGGSTGPAKLAQDISALTKSATDELAKAQEQLLRAQGKNPLLEQIKALGDQAPQALRDLGAAIAATTAQTEAAQKSQQKYTASVSAANSVVDQQKTALEQLGQYTQDIVQQFSGPLAKAQETASDQMRRIGEMARAAGNSTQALALANQALIASDQQLLDAQIEVEAKEAELQVARDRSLASLNDLLPSMQRETELLKLSDADRRIAQAGLRAQAEAQRRLSEALKSGAISQEEFNAKRREYIDQAGDAARAEESNRALIKAAQDYAEETTRIFENAGKSASDAFADSALSGFDGLGKSLRNIWKRMIADLISQSVQKNIFGPLLQNLGGIFQGGGQQQSGGFLSSITRGISGLFGGSQSGGILSSLFGGASSGQASSGIGGIFSGITRGISGLFGGASSGQSGGILSSLFGASGAGGLLSSFGSLLGPIGIAASAFSAIRGRLKFNATGVTGLNVGLGDSGATAQATEQRRRSGILGIGRRTRDFNVATSPELQAQIAGFQSQARDAVAQALGGLATTMPALVNASFSQITDKTGKVIRSQIQVLGQTIDGALEDLPIATAAATIFQGLEAITGQSLSGLVSRFSSSASAMLEAANVAALAQRAIADGTALLAGGTIEQTVTLVADLAATGESLQDAFARVAGSVDSFNDALSTMGASIARTGEEAVRFAVGVAEAAGGLDAANSLWQGYFATFYSETERASAALVQAETARTAALARIGLDAATSTAQFRAAFEAALPTLTPAQVVQWLQTGQAIGAATSAQEAYNQTLDVGTQSLEAVARALESLAAIEDRITQGFTDLERSGLTAFQRELLEIDDGLRENIRSLNQQRAAALAAGASSAQLARFDAALGRAHTLAASQAAAAIRQLINAGRDLVRRAGLGGGSAQQTAQAFGGVTEAAENAAQDVASAMISALQSVRDFLDSQLLGDLTSLTREQQFSEAQAQFQAAIAAAQSGDPEAIRRSQQLAETLLRLGRDRFASGQEFTDLQNSIRAALTGLLTLQPPPGTVGAVGVGQNIDNLGTQLGQQTDENRAEILAQLQELIRELVAATGLSLGEIATQLGLDLGEFVDALGIDLENLTATSSAALADIARNLGVELSELAGSVGADLGNLADDQSLLNDALESVIAGLPEGQAAQLQPLLDAVEAAADDPAGLARAQAALEDAITSGGPALSNLLAPYFDNIDPIDPLLGIDATLRSGFGDVVSAVDALARAIDDIGSFDVGSPGLPKNGLAKVHKGEIILDPRSSDVARRYGLGTGTVAVAGFGDVGERMLKRLEAIDSTIRTGDQINASVTYDSALSTELAIDRAARKNNKRLVMSNA